MKELKELENIIVEELQKIREKGDKGTQTLNDLDNYATLQKRLREIHNVMIYIKEMNK